MYYLGAGNPVEKLVHSVIGDDIHLFTVSQLFGDLGEIVKHRSLSQNGAFKVAEKLRNGEEVNVITANGARQYLYRVTATEVVHQDDMQLWESGVATIHLVSCVPSLVYDHRLIVTGELIGVK